MFYWLGYWRQLRWTRMERRTKPSGNQGMPPLQSILPDKWLSSWLSQWNPLAFIYSTSLLSNHFCAFRAYKVGWFCRNSYLRESGLCVSVVAMSLYSYKIELILTPSVKVHLACCRSVVPLFNGNKIPARSLHRSVSGGGGGDTHEMIVRRSHTKLRSI